MYLSAQGHPIGRARLVLFNPPRTNDTSDTWSCKTIAAVCWWMASRCCVLHMGRSSNTFLIPFLHSCMLGMVCICMHVRDEGEGHRQARLRGHCCLSPAQLPYRYILLFLLLYILYTIPYNPLIYYYVYHRILYVSHLLPVISSYLTGSLVLE